jgi:hypothetical protein
MANELYYNYLTQTLKQYKESLGRIIKEEREAAKGKSMLQDSQHVQDTMFYRFIHGIGEDKILEFKENFYNFMLIRDPTLKGYVENRVKKLMEKNPNLETKRYIQTRAMSSSTGEVEKRIVEINQYQTETDLENLLLDNHQKFLPEFRPMPPNITVLGASNIIGLYDKKKHRKAPKLEEMDYRIYSRVKKSARELEKLVDWMLGLRGGEGFPYDSIGTIEVVPMSELYKNLEEIRDMSDKPSHPGDDKTFRIDHRNLPKRYNRDQFLAIINKGKSLAASLEKSTQYPSDDERKELLTGVWIDHSVKNMRLETILQIPIFYEWGDTGPIKHDTYYYDFKRKKRIEKLKNPAKAFDEHTTKVEPGLLLVANHLERLFSDLYVLSFERITQDRN